jgi:hypothetical protein
MKLVLRGELFVVQPEQRLIVLGEYNGGLEVKVDDGLQTERRGFVRPENYTETPP